MVTKLSWYTPTSELLKQCGWLSVKQLVVYHSLMLVYKVRKDKKPGYLHKQLFRPFPCNTRFAKDGGIRKYDKLDKEIARNSFFPRSIDDWNKLPNDLKKETSAKVFKRHLKVWILKNVTIS